MPEIQVTNAFSDGDTVSATNFNTNYSDISTYINDRNSGSGTWDALLSTSSSSVPLIANNSTGTQSIFIGKDNGTTVAEVHDGGYVSFPYQSGVRCTGADQAVSSEAIITFNAKTYDPKSEFSTTTYRFTATVTGKYLVSFIATPTATGTVRPFSYIFKNGSLHSDNSSAGVSGNIRVLRNIDILSLSPGDYVEIYGELSGGSTTYSNKRLSIHKLS